MSAVSNIFRGKSDSTDVWVIGALNYRNGIPYIISITSGNEVYVKPDTICKYLDIKDAEGRRIFENDIIKVAVKGTKKAWVKYNKYVLGWVLDSNIPTNETKHKSPLLPQIDATKAHIYRVLGNIYDNSEYEELKLN